MAKTGLAYLIVAGTALVCYWNSFQCDLVHDDIFAIKENPDLHPETPWTSLFKNDFWGKSMADNRSHKSYRPLTVATFRLNYILHGLNPFGYHLVNVLLHMVVSLLFHYFCNVNLFHDQEISLFTTLLFTVHPIHTEAVTGVVGRADLLACLLFLFSLHIYLRAMEMDDQFIPSNNNLVSKPGNLQNNWSLAAVIVIGCLSMLCKENGITVIGVCILLEIARRRDDIKNFISKNLELSGFERLRRSLQKILILSVSVILAMAFRLYIMKGQLPAFNEEDNPASFSKSITTRFMTYFYLCAFNLWLLLLPACLSYDWQVGSIPLVESFTDTRNIQTTFTFVLLAALVLKTVFAETSPKSQKVPVLGFALLVIPFLPASNLFFRVGFVVAERILYIPSLGYCILIGHGFDIIALMLGKAQTKSMHLAANRTSNHKEAALCQDEATGQKSGRSTQRMILIAASAVLLNSFAFRTIDRNGVWKNRESLFRSGIETLPHNAKAHYNYANLMKDNGRTNEAISHYKAAIRLYPKHASSHNNLATLLGVSEEAEYHFKQTLVHNPYHYKAMYNLATLYRDKGKKQDAKKLLEYCLSIKPNYYDGVQVLAEVLHELGETQKAADLFYKASLKCTDANFFNSYAYFLGNLGQGELSLKAYERAIEIEPKHKISLVNYGRQLKTMGKYKEAEIIYRRALKLGRDANTLNLLAVLLYQTRRLKECELTFSEALKYEPRNEDYIRNHATAVFEQGQKDDAVDLLKDAQNMLPYSSSIAKLLVNFLMTTYKPSEALNAVKVGLDSNSDDYELHFMKANALRDLNNLDLALESYKDAARLNPKHFSSLQNIGVIYHMKGFKIEAKHFYEKALEIEPENKILKDNIAKLLRTM